MQNEILEIPKKYNLKCWVCKGSRFFAHDHEQLLNQVVNRKVQPGIGFGLILIVCEDCGHVIPFKSNTYLD